MLGLVMPESRVFLVPLERLPTLGRVHSDVAVGVLPVAPGGPQRLQEGAVGALDGGTLVVEALEGGVRFRPRESPAPEF